MKGKNNKVKTKNCLVILKKGSGLILNYIKLL